MKPTRQSQLDLLQAQFDEFRSEQKAMNKRLDEQGVELAAFTAEKEARWRLFRVWIAVTMAIASLCTAIITYWKLS